MAEVNKTALAQAWVEATGENPPENLLDAYFPRVDESELAVHGPQVLAAQTIRHTALAARYTGGDALIEIRNPAADDDDHAGNRTVIDIVVTDMRYLLSSLVSELSRTGLAIRSVRHPIMVVDRSGDGMHIVPTEDARGGTETAALPVISAQQLSAVDPHAHVSLESWIHLEVDRVPTSEFPALEAGLRHTLEFVAAAEHDREAMIDRARSIAAELRAKAPRTELAAEAREAADLLDWLEGRFAFMGYREYRLERTTEGQTLVPVEQSALGISGLRGTTVTPLSQAVASKTLEPHVLVLTKANSRSSLIRRGFMDYVGVKTFDAEGNIVGERRFVGLYTSRMYTSSVLDIPVVKTKVKTILRRSGLARDSHSGNELLSILETYPRDDLFHADTEEILDVALQVVEFQEKREASVFVRRDPYERYVSVQVYVPRDLYDTNSRVRVENVLREVYRAESVDFDVLLTDSALARLHFVARVPRDELLPSPDVNAVIARIKGALRSWQEDVAEILAPSDDKVTADAFDRVRRWSRAFPPGYVENHSAAEAVADIARFESLSSDAEPIVRVYRPHAADNTDLRLAFYRMEPALLSDILPYLSYLGAKILDERPYALDLADGTHRYIYDFGLDFPAPVDESDFRRLEDAFIAAWTGKREAGGMDRLIVEGLSWRDIAVLRAFLHYLSQANFSLSNQYMGQVFTLHPTISAELVELFRTKFDPDLPADVDRAAAVDALRDRILEELQEVESLDADRVLRSVLALIDAIVRTNVFQPTDGSLPHAMVFKILPGELDFLPKPRPAFEMWVYSPEVEGVHLRFGSVARGGLRWSDRREDFRTEVLGLVKAQMVKNAVIVPTGAKGGFYPKRLPDPAVDREAWAAAGQAAYELFINALLDVTDNRTADDSVVHPPRTVVHDAVDPYLVVAADKGTARFSDVANAIARTRGFWLDDAFASGGSVGYDHKAMGITSRGAWKSVERHFRELGVNTASEDFTVVAIGDMSGDVFGNGMLRSEHIRLVAAFDHRDIFLDPDPDPAVSFAERRRLFELPRSSWQDYDTSLISAGGGVFSRSEKSIDVSERAAAVLGIRPGPRTPSELMTAILQAPVDLLFNGGIGTYLKAESESNAAVGDKANDAIRINGGQVRAKVIGEGGNLGATQLGRIEAALAGVKLNTDAVDNSAGVDCSDHEVNIKLLLRTLIREGIFAPEDREKVLLSMTDEVGDLVLQNNYTQNIALGEARDRARSMTNTHRRLMKYLERNADLDRVVEFLPTDKELDRRAEAGQGFTSPELAVLLAYTKMDAVDRILASDLPDEPWVQELLTEYFPDSLAPYSEHFTKHPLRREIASVVLVNRIVDRGGLTYLFRMQEETNAAIPDIARTFVAVSRIFDLGEHFAEICALDNRVPTEVQVRLGHNWVRLLDRASRWLVGQIPTGMDVPDVVAQYRPTAEALRGSIGRLTRGEDRTALEDTAHEYVRAGVPQDLAFRAAGLLDEFAVLDIAQVATESGEPAEDVAEIYFGVTDLLSGHRLLGLIGALDRRTRWSALARGALRDDFYQGVYSMVRAVASSTESEKDTAQARADERIAQWRARHDIALRSVLATLDEVTGLDVVDQAPLSVLLRMIRGVVRQTARRSGVAQSGGTA